MDAQEETRVQTLQQQLPLPPGSTKNWDMQDTRQSVGQSNSVASKWASTGLQKCFKHSLYPEKESVWKTAEDRNESVMW